MGGLSIRAGHDPIALEERMRHGRLEAARAFARANAVDRVVFDAPRPRLVLVASGKALADTRQVFDDLGLDAAYANELEVQDGRFTGNVIGRVIDRDAKADLLRAIAEDYEIPIEQTVAVGDGANDLAMLEAAGLGIAFNGKPVVTAAADTALTVPYLDAVLFFLGIRREDIEAADA